MKTKTLLVVSVSILLFNSCTIMEKAGIERRVYRSGFYVHTHTSKTEKNKSDQFTNNSKEENISPAIAMGNSTYINKEEQLENLQWYIVKENSTLLNYSGKSPSNQGKADNKKENITSIHLEKKKFNPIIQKNKKSSSSDTNVCRSKGRSIKMLGIVLCLLALVLLAYTHLPALGLVFGIAGLILYFVGRSTPDPHIINTEPVIALEEEYHSTFQTPVFDYQPKSKSPEKPGVSIALLQPQYAESFQYKGETLFTEFANRMSDDFKEMLDYRGYSFKGPYEKYDEMIYNDKIHTDLLFRIKIEVKLDENNIQRHASIIPRYVNQYWSCGKVIKVKDHDIEGYNFDGTVTASGYITITASEIMTDEKVWTKSIPLNQQSITVKSDKTYESNIWPKMKDPGYYNPVAKLLEEYYKTTLQSAENYLDPRELEVLKPQIEKIRTESGFIRKQ